MKKLTVCLLLVTIFLLSPVKSNAIVHTITFDWEELGAKKIGTSAKQEDYYGDHVHNLRCNYSNWDHLEEYLWLVSDWSNSRHEPGWIYIGKHDMYKIDLITFDYVTDGSLDMTNNRVCLTKDKEGKEVVATGKIEEATSPLASPLNLEMEILEEDYNGDLYVYIEYTARMFVGNLVFTTKDDGTTPSPTPEPTPTPEATKPPIKTITSTPTPKGTSSNANIYVILSISVICILGAGAIFLIWRKKSIN